MSENDKSSSKGQDADTEAPSTAQDTSASEDTERKDARIFDTKHVFFDAATMEEDGWPKEEPKCEATLTG